MTARYIQVQWTAPHLDEARAICKELVQNRLVACASIVPLVESWYTWQGEMESAQEVKVYLKTRIDLYPRLEEIIRLNHSYECPEILIFPIEGGYGPYLKWLEDSLIPSE